jgi:hypothetical protein
VHFAGACSGILHFFKPLSFVRGCRTHTIEHRGNFSPGFTALIHRKRGRVDEPGGSIMEKLIGRVTHYYDRISVAVLEIEDGLTVGDMLHFVGHSTDFTQQVDSMEVEHQKMQAVGAGSDVALKVEEPARKGDEVYKVLDRVTHF